MKKNFYLLFILVFSCAALRAQTPAEQRIQASYMLAFGRVPSSGELSYWKTQGNKSIADLLANHRNYIKQDAATHRAVISKSYADGLGRNPSESEINYWMNGNDTYTTLMKNHVSYLAGNPAEYEKTIKRSYQYVFNKAATPAEVSYWKSQPKVSYIILVGCHQDYKKRNLASQNSNVNIKNASSVVSVPLAADIAAEASTAAGLAKSGVIAAGGDNVIAPQGGWAVAAGGANVVAPGGGN